MIEEHKQVTNESQEVRRKKERVKDRKRKRKR